MFKNFVFTIISMLVIKFESYWQCRPIYSIVSIGLNQIINYVNEVIMFVWFDI